MCSMNIVIPMAGEGRRFLDAGYTTPKPFIDVDGIPMIERVLRNVNAPGANYILIARREHVENAAAQEIAEKYGVTYITVDKLTEGTACTALYARKYINNDAPLLFANSDQIVDIDINDFVADCDKRGLCGSILTFRDEEKNNKWSFVELDDGGLVKRVAEKQPISDIATVGIYYFSKGRNFVDAAIDMIVENDRVGGEFYICPVYNYAVKNNCKIGIYDIAPQDMHGIGTPQDLNDYLAFLCRSNMSLTRD